MAKWLMQVVTRRVEQHTQRPKGQLAMKQGGGIQQGVHRVRSWIKKQNRLNTSWACFSWTMRKHMTP
eukprot:12311186-Prorocentrum_lima.AAC.1